MQSGSHFDVAIVGAGPAGCVSALAFARRGKRVLLLEADPRAADRLAGEWLHPPALAILDDLGIDLTPATPYATGKGFVFFPEDGSEPIALPYAAGQSGLAIEHALLVETLRAHCERDERIELVTWARATRIEGQTVTYERRHGAARSVSADVIVGASGRVASGPLGRADEEGGAAGPLAHGVAASSRIAGLTLEGATLPFEGFLHVFLGAPGPVMAYRIDARRVRVLCEVPCSQPMPREGGLPLYEAYAPVLPPALRSAFRVAVREGVPAWASVELRPRGELGRDGLALVGDAAGTHPPLPAIGLTLALEDAVAIAEAPSFASYRRERTRRARVREMLAVGLYEVLADDADESLAMRRAIYALWRERPRERLRSMGFLSGTDRSHLAFSRAFLGTLLRTSRDFARDARRTGRVRETGRVARDMGQRMAWLFGGTLHLTDALPAHAKHRGLGAPRSAEERYGAALRAATGKAEVVGLPRSEPSDFSAHDALRRGVGALLAEQAEDGSFEGEVVWCPMLAAQYVMAWHAMGRSLSPERRAAVLKHFERTQRSDGTWGLHERSEPYLFVTTLVYVAARLLGLAKDDPLIARAHDFIRREGGAVYVPSWGKLWLALLGLYSWEGVSAVVPEVWQAPRWLPVHPSRFYCHTRLIYLGMSVLHAEKWQAPITPRTLAIRDEIFVEPWDSIDWERARRSLRTEEVHTPWTLPLALGYRVLGAVDRVRSRSQRAALLAELRDRIRYELRSTSHTCISPVSGLLDQLALYVADPADPDLALAAERFEGWIWEDDEDGARVTGARSATWDTSFAAQALIAAAPHLDVSDALRRAGAFLASQQIRRGTGRERDHDRLDPTGGYCFAGVWHGWPVSDCTAEAMVAQLESPVGSPTREAMEDAVRFVLRCRNSDGGFGSYEARRTDVSLEWINPAEMFGDSMTEKTYVECTASCIAALAAFVHRWPGSPLAEECRSAIAEAVAALSSAQRPDGSWPAMWGVHFVYGTMFGVRGLIAGGVPGHDPRIRRACRFLVERQRADGAWGEHCSSVTVGRYVDHEQGQVVQTAWAMTALLEAGHPDMAPIERAARWLASVQRPDGSWPKQDPEGIFFHTALLDYVLYRRYFPVWALGLYESRRAARAAFRDRERTVAPAALHV